VQTALREAINTNVLIDDLEFETLAALGSARQIGSLE
jgi:hypothetical protein